MNTCMHPLLDIILLIHHTGIAFKGLGILGVMSLNKSEVQ